ncbi:olfactomedin-like protein 2B isoform X3 [Salvelinus fontinalis]|uniref:olfactomedin-like protein 2B isoform X3 n=1 Tax=Salvelinus fontinalis TaxID=8038 RepID=UPI00248697C4|nr:olfactomedin-like protein 2B isoform X3 [Salvelinus fontinalis]
MMMSRLQQLLLLWCAIALTWAPVASSDVMENSLTDVHDGIKEQLEQTEGPLLDDEMDNQENVLTQLLGDYDKVKTLSEGSDCRCKCIVRPLSRSACRRIEEGAAKAEDFYTVETVTSGPNCKKCACIAPPSALNPCEGDYRFKKLQEAGKDDIKLSTIMELLEGAFYGMDLLKLHSVTTKLLNRVDNIEKTFSRNHTEKEKVSVRSRSSEENEREKERRAQQRMEKRKRLTELEPSLQKDTAAAYVNTEKYEERYVGAKGQGATRPMLKRSQPEDREEPQWPLKGKVGPNGMVIRGVTFYKANTVDDGAGEELTAEEALSGDGSMDLLIDDQLLRPTHPRPVAGPPTPASQDRKGNPDDQATDTPKTATSPQRNPITSAPGATGTPSTTVSIPTTTTIQTNTDTTVATTTTTTQPATTTTTTQPATTTTTTQPATTTTTTQPATTTTTTQPATTTTTTQPATTTTTTQPATTTTTTQPATTTKPETVSVLTTSPTTALQNVNSTTAPTSKVTSAPRPKHHISWTEGHSEVPPATPKVPGLCKDTLATISDPVTHNTYGRKEGAWMKDPKGNGNVIYVTNYYYGNNLLEFRDMDTFKKGRFTNSYKLPYNWIGTGHVVYNGAFYYNRAFSRDIIKFDLRLRYVAAWTTLHDAVFEEEEDTSWRWRGHSDIDFGVDESGLWLVYPALDEEGFHQEVIMLNRVNPADLSLQSTFRTGLRRHFYGNSFVICGVLYAVDNFERIHANISYAYDTHTHTQMIPRLPFTNNYTYTTQIDYNPKDKKLYAWDNGHQVTYDVIFAY